MDEEITEGDLDEVIEYFNRRDNDNINLYLGPGTMRNGQPYIYFFS